MALRPDSESSSEDKQNARISAEQEMLMREVDEAVRHDQLDSAVRKYGWPIGIAVVLGLAGFGGWLYWRDQQEAKLEQGSEQLVRALDEIDAGALDAADQKLAALASDGAPGTAASAAMTRAGIALRQGKIDDAVKLFDGVAADTTLPKPYRDLAAIRSVAVNYDKLQPQQVIDRLKPLAVPGNPWFGSAGELVGMAYLAQGKPELAGPLFGLIAKDEDVPDSLRARTRQMAGLLGVDAVVDVDKTLADIAAQGDNPAPAAAE